MTMDPQWADDRTKAIKNITASLLVGAAAGTGKTSVLVARYLEILLNTDCDFSQIVAITFTEKAADEMKNRLRSEIIKRTSTLGPEPVRHLTDNLNQAPIATVHSFCARLLRENCLSGTYDPLFRIIDETEEAVRRSDFIKQFLDQNLRAADTALNWLLQHFDLREIGDLLLTIYAQQTECMPALRTLLNTDLDTLITSSADLYRQHNLSLLQNFFNQVEVQATLSNIKNTIAPEENDSLWQAFAVVMEAFASVANQEIPTALTDGSLAKALQDRERGQQQNWGARLETMRAYHRLLRKYFSHVKSCFLKFDPETESDQIAALQQLARLGQKFIESYRADLRAEGLMDFAGLELETAQLLSAPTSAVHESINRFRHLLVDEFQDINPIQYRIIQLMGAINPRLITFFVGDEKQSIYRFRGAEVEIFNRLRRQQGALHLDENFRSVRPLMDFYNHFFGLYFGSAEPPEPFEVHYPRVIRPHYDVANTQVPVELLQMATDETYSALEDTQRQPDALLETVMVAECIRRLLTQPLIYAPEGWRPVTYGDITILLRSRRHQADLEFVLQNQGIPYYVLSGIGFYSQREIIDLINALRLLINFHDQVALVGTLRSPLFGISDTTLTKLTRGQASLFAGLRAYFQEQVANEALDQTEKQALEHFWSVYTRLTANLATSSTAELLDDIIRETHYRAVLAGLSAGEQRIANVNKLLDLALEWEIAERLTPIDFIRRIEIYRAEEVHEGEANLASDKGNAVTIMTIHAAKGLDFPVVIVPFLAHKINYRTARLLYQEPDRFALQIDKEHPSFMYEYLKQAEHRRTLAEEKRLLYVAATRARSYLVFATDISSAVQDRDISLWSSASPIFDAATAAGLCRTTTFPKSQLKGFLENLLIREEPETAPAETLPPDLSRLVRPVTLTSRVVKITATQFAETVQAIPVVESRADAEPESSSLPPQEIGSLVHQILTGWDFKSLASFNQLLGEFVRPYLLTPEEQKTLSEKLEGWATLALQTGSGLHDLLAGARRQHREVEIYGAYMDFILEGKIDLLLENHDGSYSIVDFKTDRLYPETEAILLAKYALQVNLYAFILARCNCLPVRETALYFLRKGQMLKTTVSEETLDQTAKQLRDYLQSQNPTTDVR